MFSQDFSGAYLKAREFRRRVVNGPESVGPESVAVMAEALADRTHYSQSNARFLYLETARALAELAVLSPDREVAESCLEILETTVTRGNSKALLAAGEAMGSLPLDLPCPDVPGPSSGGLPHATWDDIAESAGVSPLSEPIFIGRTLAAPVKEGGSLSVKLARRGPGPAKSLHREAAWADQLARDGFGCECRLPRPVRFKGRYVFRLTNMDYPSGAPRGLPRDTLAVAFAAPPGYYDYPNDTRPGRLPDPESFLEMMGRNARLLGILAGRGIMHRAAVPLFHNRIQGARRPDQGIYEWRRMGRLDRWLESSLFPNFGASGLRDFEHLEPLKRIRSHRPRVGNVLDSPELCYGIGDHALALLLVAGSYFRARRPELRGRDGNGEAVDARSLFDRELLIRVIEAVFLAYVRGFSGLDPQGPCPIDASGLAGRMIEEMGVDRHMEEIIRARDQNDMTREHFRNLLVSGGFSPSRADLVPRGDNDVTILTGPHLGDFNGATSLPELSLFAATLAGLAVAAGFRRKRAGRR